MVHGRQPISFGWQMAGIDRNKMSSCILSIDSISHFCIQIKGSLDLFLFFFTVTVKNTEISVKKTVNDFDKKTSKIVKIVLL